MSASTNGFSSAATSFAPTFCPWNQMSPLRSIVTDCLAASCCSRSEEHGSSMSTFAVFMKFDASMKKMISRKAMSPMEESGRTKLGFFRLLIAIFV